MSQFKEFEKKHGPAQHVRPVPAATVAAFSDKLPEPLIQDWKDIGWCSYGKGLIWIEDPAFLQPMVKAWFGPKNAFTAFARSGFGHLFLWDKKDAYMLDPQHGTLAKIVSKLEVLFDYVLCRKPYLDDVLDLKLFRAASKKLGELAFDECYGFVPALALGGEAALANLEKLKLAEHELMLSQLVDEVRSV